MNVWTVIVTTQRTDDGASFVEYALTISLIVLSSLAALRIIGVQVDLDIRQLIDLFR